ncbi:uncharacterized protein LOC105190947 isoform X2 [Harpegnathos saltator]|uniref:uncharacterized protein LOC105190947 isoform X2 n=1 Tax=Harpegnathos saltator TaxID=610380 RepID=UPI00058ED0C5|nr:uncharacterized protein LOC105190947 isoform X2 [Harpegnathos saltator]
MNACTALSTVLWSLVLLLSSFAQNNRQSWFNNGQGSPGQFGAGGNIVHQIPVPLNVEGLNAAPITLAIIPLSSVPSVGISNWQYPSGGFNAGYPNGGVNRINPNGITSSGVHNNGPAITAFSNGNYFNGRYPNNGYPNGRIPNRVYPNIVNGNTENFNGQNPNFAIPNVPHNAGEGYPNRANGNTGNVNGQNPNIASPPNVFPQNGGNPNRANGNGNLNGQNFNTISPNVVSHNGGDPNTNYPDGASNNGGHLNGQNPNIATANVVLHNGGNPNGGYPNGASGNRGHSNGQNSNIATSNVVPHSGGSPDGVNGNAENFNGQNPNIVSPNVVHHTGSDSNGRNPSVIYPNGISSNGGSQHSEVTDLNNRNGGNGQRGTYNPSRISYIDGRPLGLNNNFHSSWTNANTERSSKNKDETETSFQSSIGSLNRVPEKNGKLDHAQCREDEFRCKNNVCIPLSAKCDNKTDCRDASDEAYCTTDFRSRNQENSCVLPEQPIGGRYKLTGCEELCHKRSGDTVPEHSVITYTCKDDYKLSDKDTSVCLNSEWFHQVSCLKICPELKSTTVNVSCTYRGEKVSCSDPILPGTRATMTYCGKTVSQGQQLIVNGVKAKMGLFPWHVGIYEKDGAKTYKHICGGNLISNNLVVSAAHCFYDEVKNKPYNASNYAVGAGKYYRSWDAKEQYSQKSLVEFIKLRRRYMGKRNVLAEDIALVKLQTPLNLNMLVRPICVDWQNIYDKEQLQLGQSGKLAGWGKDITGKPTEELYEVTMPYVPNQKCLDDVPLEFRGLVTRDKFCAGRMNGSSACDGDSGGGLCFGKDGIWYLRGIVSVSPQKNDHCDYTSYVAFTRISAYLPWIHYSYTRT